MLEPVMVMGDGKGIVSWSTGRDVGRIIPHVLAHPLSRNAICPVAATVSCSWDDLLALRERTLGRKVERMYLGWADWKAAYDRQPSGAVKELMAIGVLSTGRRGGHVALRELEQDLHSGLQRARRSTSCSRTTSSRSWRASCPVGGIGRVAGRVRLERA